MVDNSLIIEAFNFRHACKVFDKNRKISDSDFLTILESARLSASSFGFEPWKFLVVQNAILREKLRDFTWGAQDTLPTASHFVVILARKDMHYSSEYIEYIMRDIHKIEDSSRRLRKDRFKKFQENDFNLLDSDRALFDWASKQTYIAMANMINTASLLRIDSCPIEGFNIKKIEQVLKDDFKVDVSKFGISLMVAFGYRLNPQNKKTRQSLKDIVEYF